jgi:hypothetical protein
MTIVAKALHVGHTHHQPWCRIYHNPASTNECWCDAQMAVTAYKIGYAEGMAAAALRMRASEQKPQDDADDVVIVEQSPRHLPGGSDVR